MTINNICLLFILFPLRKKLLFELLAELLSQLLAKLLAKLLLNHLSSVVFSDTILCIIG